MINDAIHGKYNVRTTLATISCLNDRFSGTSIPIAMPFRKKPVFRSVRFMFTSVIAAIASHSHCVILPLLLNVSSSLTEVTFFGDRSSYTDTILTPLQAEENKSFNIVIIWPKFSANVGSPLPAKVM
jgi:hypothetical protein